MAGYDEYSMSNNARDAYSRGLVVASKISGIPAALVKKHCRYEEKHHTSNHYNMTEFYDPKKVLATFGLGPDGASAGNADAIADLANYKTSQKNPEVVHADCKVTYLEWVGKKHPKCTTITAVGAVVTLKAGTAKIVFANGSKLTKRLTTKGFTFIPDYSKTLVQANNTGE